MTLKVIGSGSSGNCYLLLPEDPKERGLMLEAGMPFREVVKAMQGDTGRIAACLVTHEHKDHAGHVASVIEHGIQVWATGGTRDAIEDWPKMRRMKGRIKRLPFELMFQMGRFDIIVFHTLHDAAEPCGFYIRHPECGLVVFATDTRYIPGTFDRIDHWLIECNHDVARLEAREDIPEAVKERIRWNHMSIDTCIEDILANDRTHLKDVTLIHISSQDGDPDGFVQRVDDALKTECISIPVVAARPGMSIELHENPF